MTWVKLDDKLHRNPKVLATTDAAHRIYIDGLSYCGDTPEPTGYFSEVEARAFVHSRGKPTKVIEELVTLQLWERVPDGYLIHDFEKYLPKKSTDRVRAFRERKRNAKATRGEPLHIKGGNAPETSGNSSSHARGFPVPDPVPVPVKAPPAPSGGNGKPSDAVKDPTTELGLGMHELLGRQLSAIDLTECQLALNQYAYMSATDLIARAHEHVEYCADHELPTPRTVAGFADTWRRENDHRADQGLPKATRDPRARVSGLERAFPPPEAPADA